MRLALFGPSCVGKTTIALAIAERRDLAIRCCGSVVRSAAQDIGLSPQALPDTVHREIDLGTIQWVSERVDCIVEGRFLDHVLKDAPAPLALIRLIAPAEVRLARACSRGAHVVSIDDLDLWDRADAEFRGRMYPETALAAHICVDTSSGTVNDCVNQIISAMFPSDQRPG